MNYSNSAPQNTVESLQAYVIELTAYINENNRKYTKNLQTLKQFYEKQINDLDNVNQENETLILQQKNQIITLKDVLVNRNAQIKQLKDQVQELKENLHESEENLFKERNRNQETYHHMDKLRQTMQQQINKEAERARNAEDSAAQTIIQLKEKDSENQQLKKQINKLSEQLSERYSMPEKMKQYEIQRGKDKTTIDHLKQNLQDITRQRDFMVVQIEKKRKQNQKLTIDNKRSRGDQSYEIEIAVKKEKEKLLNQMENIKLENERKIFEINDLEVKLKEKVQLCQHLQAKMKEGLNLLQRRDKEVSQLKEDKDLYLAEFRKLKYEYEEVIQKLQYEIPNYQQKNWSLQQQNKELNQQLDGLQELLRELKAMNDMEPMKKDYRRWAELNLMAEKKIPQTKINNFEEVYEPMRDDGLQTDWNKLLLEIENIQV